MTEIQQIGPVGVPYDHKWTDSQGTIHYSLKKAMGGAEGPASWSDEHDCNLICGHHLAWRCGSCWVCTECDGCYCRENDELW